MAFTLDPEIAAAFAAMAEAGFTALDMPRDDPYAMRAGIHEMQSLMMKGRRLWRPK